MDYIHWSMQQDENNICWLLFDYKDSAMNILSSTALQELDHILDQINDSKVQAIVFKSLKSSGFIAGANIKEFVGIDYDAALELITLGHTVMNKIEAMKCNTISMIHGFSMGGGTELSLACDYIVCSDDVSTRLSLPEVKLGIHPGFGGSLRCIRRIGPLAAFDMMLTGRAISAKQARRIKLVDEVTAQRQLERAAIAFAHKKPSSRKQSIKNRLLNNALVRGFLARKISEKVARKAPKAHYPAPYKLINLWLKYYDFPKKMLEKEAISVAELVADPTAQNLVRVYFLQEQLKSLGDKKLFTPLHVHVIGGGIMGGDIAAWCAFKGFQVSVQDQDPAILAKTIQRACQLFKKKLRDERLITNTLDRLTADHKGYGIEHADIIIEAIFEDAKVKQTLYQSIEPRMKKGAILATNTSSIPLETLASCLKNPGRLVGLHFFNPVALMPLVEIIHGEQSDKKTIAKVAAFSRHIDKLPLAVKSSPGFLVNRILMPYLLEAIIMYAEGIPAEAIDKAALEFGMPMGPIELADTVGLDVCLSVANILSESSNTPVPEQLEHMVKTGHLGKKNNKGFYSYRNGKAQKDSTRSYKNMKDVQQRLILMLVNEATACLRDKIVDNEDLLDAGVIFGTGFAPFRGGPIKYIHDNGKHDLQTQMDSLKKQLGERFTQDNGWDLV
ncbi:MAG: 3-hydroxyacyl-CoA dehydrogenase NAD-binding domain-containing protein [Gammaproteobacteria bacterium]|nr:3-hydroxyacyl-CoA dehydrogenase NAD-binding domain-containing protein [Gammaproteobacteria bacterium]